MIASLSQEQQWGWAYLHQEHSKGIDRQNAAIDEANSLLPEGVDPQPHVIKPTLEEYVGQRLAAIGDEGYRQILRIKEQTALAMFHALPAEQQAELIEQFQIPPVLEG